MSTRTTVSVKSLAIKKSSHACGGPEVLPHGAGGGGGGREAYARRAQLARAVLSWVRAVAGCRFEVGDMVFGDAGVVVVAGAVLTGRVLAREQVDLTVAWVRRSKHGEGEGYDEESVDGVHIESLGSL